VSGDDHQGSRTVTVRAAGWTGSDVRHHGGERVPPCAERVVPLTEAREATSLAAAERGSSAIEPAAGEHDHIVGFYESDGFLTTSVVDFVLPALRDGTPVILIATEPHRKGIETALQAAGVDLADAHERGLLRARDARETLDTIMDGDRPDPERFRTVIGGLIADVSGTGYEVRAYGEMVALLWEEGRIAGAIALEDLWNALAESYPFALLCTYPMEAFDREEATDAFHTVCRQHSAVIPSESYSQLSDPGERARAVARLQQEASAGVKERLALREKQTELEAALDRLRELDRLRNEFVAMVVHDIRSPAALTAGFLGMLRDSWPDLEESEIEEFLARALESTEQVQRLVDDILTMSRLDSGEFTYDLQPIDLRSVVERAVSEVRSTTHRTIEVSAQRDLPPALADENRQVQILTNLLSNAVKFSPDSTVVRVAVRERGDEIVVRVRDEGVGISDEDAPKLFRPFSRLNPRTERQSKGTGLGLYISKALVEGQGGTIWFDSVEGDGSTFAYTVPKAPTST
jgi:signal transduction histidine kinase